MPRTLGQEHGRRGRAAGFRIVLGVAVLLAGTVPAAAGPDDKAPRTAEELERLRKAHEAEGFVKFFLRMYNQQMESQDWVARAMAVINMARIDHARMTDRLLEVLQNDGTPIVRAYAWAALHARRDRLTREQQTAWEEAAYELYKGNALRGELRLGLLGIAEARGPNPRNRALLKHMLDHTNSMDSHDIRTLKRIGEVIAAWGDREMVRHLIAAMGTLDTAYRAELVLHQVSDAVPLSYNAGALPPEHRGHAKHTHLRHEGSKIMWAVTQRRWHDWFQEHTFAPRKVQEDARYTGVGTLLPAGEKIVDASADKWQRELELPQFRIGNLDVGIVMDSTASMSRVIRWVQRDVVKLMETFKTISLEPRIGVILYRDPGDAYIVKGIRLTTNARRLKSRLEEAGAKGGGDMPEAVYAALHTMLHKQRWSKNRNTSKVVILLGDAPPHEENLPQIRTLVETAAKDNYQFHCVKVRTYHSGYFMRALGKKNWDPKLTSFDRIAGWGNGRSFWVSFMAEYGHRHQRTARATSGHSPAQVILHNVLQGVLAKEYRDRVDPFLRVLLEYVHDPLVEQRSPFGPRTYGHGHHKPTDPQEQR